MARENTRPTVAALPGLQTGTEDTIDDWELVEKVMEGPGQTWGLLRWKDRYFAIRGTEFLVYKSEDDAQSGASPKQRIDLTAVTCHSKHDSTRELTLDDGAALTHLKFPSESARSDWETAIQGSTPGDGRSTSSDVMAARLAKYPLKIGGSPPKYHLGELLGEGGFAKVKSGIDSEGKRIAAKIMPAREIREEHQREIVNMGILKHENIVEMIDVVMDAPNLYIILELASGGELFSKLVDGPGHFDEKTARYYFWQIMRGVLYCHCHNLCHRDLKLENLLLDASGDKIKITDFGFAKNMESGCRTILGTAVYVAPEVLDGEAYDGALADVWSCGVILYTLICGRYPFQEAAGTGGVGGTPQQNVRLMNVLQKQKYKMTVPCSDSLIDLMDGLMEPDPEKRLTTEQVVMHPWVVGEDADVKDAEAYIAEMKAAALEHAGEDSESRQYWEKKAGMEVKAQAQADEPDFYDEGSDEEDGF